METLTAREREAMQVIQGHVAAYGYPPSVREIGSAMGVCAASAQGYLEALTQKGVIRRHAQRSRAIAVVREV